MRCGFLSDVPHTRYLVKYVVALGWLDSSSPIRFWNFASIDSCHPGEIPVEFGTPNVDLIV